MVIDLQKCVGCGACAIACKTENNTQNRANGQSFNWADYLIETGGKFPDVKYTNRPVLCNHCTDAPCVDSCPVTPKAIFKTEDGITMINQDRCIGCLQCQEECPYSQKKVESDEWSVISFNDFDKETQGFYRDRTELIKDGTASGAEIAKKAGDRPPMRTMYNHPDYKSVRRKGIVEKCIFCDHRVKEGKDPYCVESCPASARVFGDLNDKNSNISKVLKKHKSTVLKPEEGTSPNVFYIRSFKKVMA